MALDSNLLEALWEEGKVKAAGWGAGPGLELSSARGRVTWRVPSAPRVPPPACRVRSLSHPAYKSTPVFARNVSFSELGAFGSTSHPLTKH